MPEAHNVRDRRYSWRAATAALCLLLSVAGANAQDVQYYLISKSQDFIQNSSGVPILLASEEQPFGFFSLVTPVHPFGVYAARLRGPNGHTNYLTDDLLSDPGGELEYTEFFETKIALDTAFPNGTYTFMLDTLLNGPRTATLGLSDSYPNTPRLTNWVAAQAVNSEQDFTLNWEPFTGGTTNDLIQLTIRSEFGEEVPLDPSISELTGKATSAQIPALSLLPGQNYSGVLAFTKVLPINTSYPGASGIVALVKVTRFPLLTATPQGRFQFSAANYSVSETGVVANITVIRTNGSQGTVSVDYYTGQGSANGDFDYASTSGTLVFEDGVTSNFFQVAITDDSEIEGAETVQLILSNPQSGAALGTLASATLTIIDDDVPTGPNVISYLVAKGQRFEQSGPGLPLLASNDFPYLFVSFVDGAFPGAINRASLRLPNGSTNSMINDGEQFQLKTNVSSKAMLDGAFGAGTYLFSIQPLTDSPRSPSLNLPADSYPPTPRLTNWAAAQAVDASGDFVVAWDPFTGGTSNDFVHLSIEDSVNDRTAYDSPGFVEPNALNGLNKSFTIPAYALDPLQNYHARLLFVKRTALNTNGYPGATGISGYFKQTHFSVVTAAPPPAAGRFRFSAPTYSVMENGGVKIITVLRSGGALGEASVDYATGSGTGTPNIDFVPAAGTLQFLEGEASKDFSVQILDDPTLEGNETVSLVLSNPTGGADLAQPTHAVLTIVDNELSTSGTIQFSVTNYTVSEAGPAATITIGRSGGLAAGASVFFSTAHGTATSGDYVSVSSNIIFAANQTTRTVAVPIINDSLDETNETVLLSLSNPSGGASLGSRSNAVLVIQDNDAGGVISFSAATYSVSETGKMANIIVNRSGGSASPVSVEFATSDGTATAGIDYANASATLYFLSNQLSQTVPVFITDDSLAEGNETVLLTLRNPAGGASLGTISNAVLTIADDEMALQFSSDFYTNNETAGSAPITITRSGPLTNSVMVTLFTVNGTATNGLDYVGITTNLTLGVGVASRTFSIPIINDTIADGNETVDLFLSNPAGGAQLGGRTHAVLLLVDNDVGGVIQFSAASYIVPETGSSATITINRTGGAAGGVTVNFSTADGTATAGLDYRTFSTNITFALNETTKTVSIPIINDTDVEPNETILLSLTDPGGGASLGSRSNAVLTITDNDTAVQFSSDIYTNNETAGAAVVTIVRSGQLTNMVTVTLRTADGTATAGLDYTAVQSNVVLAAGVASRTVSIPILNDTIVDSNETVNLSLTDAMGAPLGARSNAMLLIVDNDAGGVIQFSATNYTVSIPILNDTIVDSNETVNLLLTDAIGAPLGARSNAMLLIVDNDAGGVIQFSATNYTVTEAGPAALITISRTGGSASDVTVDFSTADGTAANGFDYIGVSTNLTFVANETSKTISIPIINDTDDETNETVSLFLRNPTHGATLGARSNAVLVIQDNDVGGVISFSAATYSTNEAAGAALITVNRTGGSAGRVTVQFATADVSATAGEDYTGMLSVLSFEPNQISQTIAIPISSDTLPETNETVRLTLRNPTGGATLGSISNAVLTIVEDDIAFQFSSDFYTTSEAAGAATITVLRSGPLSSAVSVMFSTSDDTASEGLDYRRINTNLTFAAGVSSRTVSIPIINDTIVDANETVLLRLSEPSAGTQLGNRANAVLLIVDNDAGGTIQFSAATYTVSEAGPAASITVSRTGGLAGNVKVDFSTADETASDGGDYVAVFTTITFGANETTRTVSIPILNDAVAENDKTVRLSLSNPTEGASLGPMSDAVLLIHDDDVGGVISFSVSRYTTNEAAGTATITVNRTGGKAEVNVDYSAEYGPAIAYSDFIPTFGTLSFGSNEMQKTFEIELIDNDQPDGDKAVILELSNPAGGATLGAIRAAALIIKDDEVDVRGVYNVSIPVSTSQCADNNSNGKITFNGQVNIFDQTGHVFTGSALLISTTPPVYRKILILGQVLDGNGNISGSYQDDNGGYGTYSGSVNAGTMKLAVTGSDTFDTSCVSTGALSGSLYVPLTGGFAPAYPQGAPNYITATVSTSSGLLAQAAGSMFALQAFLDNQYDIYDIDPITGDFSYNGSGFYIYTKTGVNTVTLKIFTDLFDEEVTETVTLTFRSPTAGSYSVSVTGSYSGRTGSQTGTFTGSL